jgi:hypothetical protein
MSIKRERSSAQPGSVSFHVANEAISQTHDLIIVAFGKIKHLGEASDLKPDASGMLNVVLRSGANVLICNRQGRHAAGIGTPFTVAGN